MKLIPNAITTRCARQLLVGQMNSPRLLFGAGVVGVLGTTVLACRATLKLEDVLATVQHDLDVAKGLEHEDYSETDRKKDITIVYVQGTVRVCKLYAPAVMLGCASVAALTKSHNILTQRNIALTAAYAAIEKGFNEYRERVVEKYGKDQDREFRYASETVEVVGTKGKRTQELRVSPDAESIYAKFFDQTNTNWSKEAEYNLLFLRAQQNYVNDLLTARGHMFLNEVYYALGMDHTSAGAVVGWVISKDGDNFIDFGIFDDQDQCRNFVNGREASILLDFNVDGVIWDKIDDNKRGEVKWQS